MPDEVLVVVLLLLVVVLLLDDALVLVRARLPMTLNVTENGSLFGLLKRSVRAPETSFDESTESVPTLVE